MSSKQLVMKEQDNIEKLTESIRHIQKAEPGPFLFEKIKVKIEAGNLTQKYSSEINTSVLWLWAISISLVISFNLFVISKNETIVFKRKSTENIVLVYPQFNYSY